MQPSQSLLIGSPAYDGIQAGCFASILETRAVLDMHRIPSAISVVAMNAMVFDARNRLIRNFRSSQCTHLLMVDSDVSFQPSTVIQMLSLNRDFIAGAVPMRGFVLPNIVEAIKRGLEPLASFAVQYNIVLPASQLSVDGDGLVLVEKAGGAFVMVSRKMVDQMVEAYPELLFDDSDGEIAGLFHPIIAQRRFLGEDYAFCQRWTDIGGKIWLLPHADFVHTGPALFSGNFQHTMIRADSDQEL